MHVLTLTDIGDVRRKVARLERQVVDAFGFARDRLELAGTPVDEGVPMAIDTGGAARVVDPGDGRSVDDEAQS